MASASNALDATAAAIVRADNKYKITHKAGVAASAAYNKVLYCDSTHPAAFNTPAGS